MTDQDAGCAAVIRIPGFGGNLPSLTSRASIANVVRPSSSAMCLMSRPAAKAASSLSSSGCVQGLPAGVQRLRDREERANHGRGVVRTVFRHDFTGHGMNSLREGVDNLARGLKLHDFLHDDDWLYPHTARLQREARRGR
jgi:hypothetical protein